MDSETPREFYERRVHEIMEKYLKNIKECDQDPHKKTPWDTSIEVDKSALLDKSSLLDKSALLDK